MNFGRATIQISTGKLIEFQSGLAPLGTLTQNAINAGISDSDILEKYISKEELDILMPKLPSKDYKSMYASALSADNKFSVIAQMLGLEVK